jgi:outer membrane protein assembly factor BamB
MAHRLTHIAAMFAANLAAAALLTTPALAAQAPLWRAPVGTDGASSPAYANGTLFVGTATGLVGLDPATGAIIIHVRSGPVSTTPAVIRGVDPIPEPPSRVIFGSRDGSLHAVSTAGEPLWHAGLGAPPASPLVIRGIGDPTIRVIVGAGNTLFAFDGDGNRQWATVLEGGDISKPAAFLTAAGEPERVIVPAGNRLYALDAATGAVIWSIAPSLGTLGAPAIGNPNLIGDPHILVGDQNGTLFSLEPRRGAVLGTFTAAGAISGSPAIGNPNQSGPQVFLGDGGGKVYAIDQTDERPSPVWRAALGGPIDGSPVLADGVLYAATNPQEGDARIAALDAGSGRQLFDSVLPGGAAAAPIVADGRLIVATRSGDVLAYDGPDS